MSYRWSKSLSAYTKWSFIFTKDLPTHIHTEQSALTVAAYIRDVIWFAHENKLRGSEWYRNVVVSALDEHTILLQPKQSETERTMQITAHPSHSIFDLMQLAQENTLREGYSFLRSDSFEDIQDLLRTFGFNTIDLGDSLCQISSSEEGIDNAI